MWSKADSFHLPPLFPDQSTGLLRILELSRHLPRRVGQDVSYDRHDQSKTRRCPQARRCNVRSRSRHPASFEIISFRLSPRHDWLDWNMGTSTRNVQELQGVFQHAETRAGTRLSGGSQHILLFDGYVFAELFERYRSRAEKGAKLVADHIGDWDGPVDRG